MSLVDYLVEEKTCLELAQQVASQAHEIARLKNEVKTLQVKMFWLFVDERKKHERDDSV